MVKTIDYILYPRYLNPQSGNKARVYIRRFNPEIKRGETLYLDLPIDFVIPSFEFRKENTEKKVTALESAVEKMGMKGLGIRFSSEVFNDTKNVIHAHLPDKKKKVRESLRKISSTAGLGSQFFLVNKMSPSEYLRAIFPPFSLVDILDPDFNISLKKGAPSLENIINDTHLAIDIETENWDKPDIDDIVSQVILVSNKAHLPKIIFSRYSAGIDEIKGYNVIRFENHKHLESMLLCAVKNIYNPLSIAGFNQAFDQLMLRQCLPSYRAGIDFTEPRVLSASGRTKSIKIHGVHVIDLFNKFNYELPYLKNNKLETIMQHFRFPFSKSINYFEQAKAFKSAEKGDSDNLRETLNYVAGDGDATIKLLLDVIDEIYTDALALQTRPASICKGFEGNADEVWMRRYFNNRKTLLHRYQHGYIPRIDPEQFERMFYKITKKIVIEKDSTGHDKPKALMPRRKGEYKSAAFIFPTLLLQALEPLYQAHPELKNYWEYYKNTPLELIGKKYRGLFKLQHRMVLPLTFYKEVCEQFKLNPCEQFPQEIEMIKLKNGRDLGLSVRNKEFLDTYGNGKCDLWMLNESLVKQAELWNSLFHEEDLINYSNRFLLIDSETAHMLDSDDKRLGIIIAEGPAISFENRFLLYDPRHDTIYMQGVSLTKRDKSKWEQNLIMKLLKESLMYIGENGRIDSEGSRMLREIFEDALYNLSEGNVKRSELLFVQNNRRRRRREMNGQLSLIEKPLPKEQTFNDYVGLLKGRHHPVSKEEFLQQHTPLDVASYKKHFKRAYSQILYAIHL